jgi:predicted CxxxxCH...CXXCH cytochrome family protein
MTSGAYGSPTCASNYCHSSGRPLTTGSATAFEYKTVTWSQVGTLDCKGCHGSVSAPAFTSQFGEPNYANGGANVVNSNSHEKHVKTSAASCAWCHAGMVNATATAIVGTSHTNGTRNVVIAASFDTNAGALNYNAVAKSCTGVSCHGGSSTVVWGSTLTCTSCHNTPPQGGEHSTHSAVGSYTAYNATASQSTTTQYGIACYTCHAGTHGNSTGQGTSAVPFNVEVTSGFGYVVGTSPFNTYAHTTGMYFRWSTTGTTCSAVYCHSNANPLGGINAYNAVAWGRGAFTAAERCVRCHKMSATAAVSDTNLSHSHQVHTAVNASGGYYYNCSQCHQGVATGQSDYPTSAGTIVNAAAHAAGTHTLAFNATQNPFNATYATTYNTAGAYRCSNLYCHSTGVVTTPQSSVSIPWNAAAAADCTSCHPGNASAAATMGTGSHTAHVANEKYACGVCHVGTVAVQNDRAITNRTRHVNRVVDVLFNASYTGTGSVYNAVDNKCYSVSCHGSGAPVWGGTGVTCSSCHTTTAAADVTVYNVAFPAGSTPLIRLAEWNATGGLGGHGVTAYGINSQPNPCLYCHDSAAGFGHKNNANPFRLRGAVLNTSGISGAYNSSATAVNAVCLNCHSNSSAVRFGVDPDGGAAGYAKVTVANAAKQMGSWHAMNTVVSNGGSRCWDCHDAHGDGNLHMVGKNVTKTALDPSGWNGNRLTGIAFTTSTAGSDYAVSAPNATKICDACHSQTAYYASGGSSNGHYIDVCTSCHAHQNTTPSAAFEGSGDCDACHNKAQGTRRDIVIEFKNTWSHKRSSTFNPTNMSVNKWDCIVCHMEGNPADGKMSGKHKNGVIDLRDPDTGNQIQGVNWINATGTYAGGWNSNGTAFNFVKFSRNLNSSTLEAWTKAVMVNQCLKCHDSDGAKSISATGLLNALVSKGYSAAKPFNTTIKINATNVGFYNTAGYVALNVVGGVVDVNASFKRSNASYHPVTAAQNNWYAKSSTMKYPWNAPRVGSTATTANWGYVLSCWDCHSGTNQWGVQTGTVTAHGGPVTVRADPYVSSTSNTTNFCRICHLNLGTPATGTHGTFSAWSTNINQSARADSDCKMCHGSATTKPPRPLPGEDWHGFDRLVVGLYNAAATSDVMWPKGPQETVKPYAFLRNTGNFKNNGSYWRPLSAPGWTGTTGGCNISGGCSSSTNRTYLPGGVY